MVGGAAVLLYFQCIEKIGVGVAFRNHQPSALGPAFSSQAVGAIDGLGYGAFSWYSSAPGLYAALPMPPTSSTSPFGNTATLVMYFSSAR